MLLLVSNRKKFDEARIAVLGRLGKSKGRLKGASYSGPIELAETNSVEAYISSIGVQMSSRPKKKRKCVKCGTMNVLCTWLLANQSLLFVPNSPAYPASRV